MNKELKKIIDEDKEYYYGKGLKRIFRFLTHNPLYQRGKYITIARKTGYYSKSSGILNKIFYLYYTIKTVKLQLYLKNIINILQI